MERDPYDTEEVLYNKAKIEIKEGITLWRENMDLSRMGYREIEESIKILTAYKKGVPNGFDNDNVTLAFNFNSGYVFLTNDSYQSVMYDEKSEELVMFYSTPHYGYEGTGQNLYDRIKEGSIEFNMDNGIDFDELVYIIDRLYEENENNMADDLVEVFKINFLEFDNEQ